MRANGKAPKAADWPEGVTVTEEERMIKLTTVKIDLEGGRTLRSLLTMTPDGELDHAFLFETGPEGPVEFGLIEGPAFERWVRTVARVIETPAMEMPDEKEACFDL